MTNTIIIAVLFAYMVYSAYKAFVIFRKHKQALSEFQKAHTDAKIFDSSKAWVFLQQSWAFLAL